MVCFSNVDEVGDFSESQVSKFYDGQTVLLTGATGFLGKVVFEKLLRQCPGIKTFYLLVRPRKGYTAKERLEKILKCALFNLVLKENPSVVKKVILIEGEIQYPNFGLPSEKIAELESTVSVVIHCAATVKFKESLSRHTTVTQVKAACVTTSEEVVKLTMALPSDHELAHLSTGLLQSALISNVVGTSNVLSLGRRMPNLQAMVHVSTAYSNCVHSEVFEEIYHHEGWNHKHILQLLEWMSEDMLEAMRPMLLRDYPNAYTYSKALAEQMVAEEAKVLPVVVVRPSVIITTLKEPIPGWVDSFNGPAGLIIALGTGLLQSVCTTSVDIRPDMVPCDYVSNTVIVAAYKRATCKHNEGTIQVYNSVTGPKNRISMMEFHELAMPLLLNNPPKKLVRYPRISITFHPFINRCRIFLFHRIPFYFADLIIQLLGHKPVLSRLLTKVEESMSIVRYFFENEWTFHNDKTRELYSGLNHADQQLFPMLNDNPKWQEILEVGYWGGRKHLLREHPSSVIEGRKKLKRLYWISWLTDGLVIGLLGYALYKIYSYVSLLF